MGELSSIRLVSGNQWTLGAVGCPVLGRHSIGRRTARLRCERECRIRRLLRQRRSPQWRCHPSTDISRCASRKGNGTRISHLPGG